MYVYTCEEIHYKELAYMSVEANQAQDLQGELAKVRDPGKPMI